MPTILDVASRAGVGVGTVSRVLNNSEHVTEATRDKVNAAIAELDYRPSSAARALSSGRSSFVPVFATNVTLPSTTPRLAGILDVVDELHEIVLCEVAGPIQRAGFVERHSGRLPAFGVLAISLHLDESEIAAFDAAEVPLVSIDYEIDGVPSLVIDDVAAAATATQHLLDLGHTEIAFLGDKDSGDYRTRASVQRRSGYRTALRSAGVSPRPGLEHSVTKSKKQAAAELLGRASRPTAVITDADSTALCLLAVARSMGLSVPRDLSVVGFDDLWAAGAAGLTTVAQPLEESGRLGASMLFSAASGEAVPTLTTLRTELIVRETSGPPS